jgi:hypothetical protein
MKYIIIYLLLFSGITSAGVGSGAGTIDQLYTKADGSMVRVLFSNGIKNPDPGSCPDNRWYIVELDSSAGSNRFYSTLLAAYMAKKSVSFWVDGCTTETYWSTRSPTITDIYMN